MAVTIQDNVFFDAISGFLADVQAKSKDGITIAEAAELLNEFLAKAISLADVLANPGTDKKALVLDAMGSAFDIVWPLIPLPMILAMFRPFITTAARAVVLAIASGCIEAMVARLRAREAAVVPPPR